MTELLANKRCLACEGGAQKLDKPTIIALLGQLAAWELNTAATQISRRFTFKNFHHTMAFVNALAWIAHSENHHPDLELGYNYCLVKLWTHALDGLSENDFILAAKIDQLAAT